MVRGRWQINYAKEDIFWNTNTALEAHADNNPAVIATSYSDQQVFTGKLTLSSIGSIALHSVFLFIYLQSTPVIIRTPPEPRFSVRNSKST